MIFLLPLPRQKKKARGAGELFPFHPSVVYSLSNACESFYEAPRKAHFYEVGKSVVNRILENDTSSGKSREIGKRPRTPRADQMEAANHFTLRRKHYF